jgi:hypothetical protein
MNLLKESSMRNTKDTKNFILFSSFLSGAMLYLNGRANHNFGVASPVIVVSYF